MQNSVKNIQFNKPVKEGWSENRFLSFVFQPQIQFDTDIYGTFRQSLVLDLGEEPVLVRHLCVDSSPVTDLDKLHMDLLLSEQGRWDLANIHKVAFEPK